MHSASRRAASIPVSVLLAQDRKGGWSMPRTPTRAAAGGASNLPAQGTVQGDY